MASLVEYFKQPLREIEAKFTKSELVLIGWRSQEQSAALMQRTKRSGEEKEEDFYTQEEVREASSKVPKEFLNEEGQIDGRKMTGQQLYRYFGKLGLPLPLMQRNDGR